VCCSVLCVVMIMIETQCGYRGVGCNTETAPHVHARVEKFPPHHSQKPRVIRR
jgi:hypothetical protein